MRILVTNDDGITEPGLLALAGELSGQGHEVVVAGPSGQWSGSAASLGTVEHQALIEVRAASLPLLDGVSAVAVQGPPALAVRAACIGALGPMPDLVVSGINPGFNAGRLIIHSGTVGAAMTAASLDVCGIAVSTDGGPGFTTAASVASMVVATMTERGLPPVAVSVNVPDVPLDELAGVEEGLLGRDSISTVDFHQVDGGLLVRRGTSRPPFPPATDSDLLARKTVSITTVPLPWDLPGDPVDIVAGVRQRLADSFVTPLGADHAG